MRGGFTSKFEPLLSQKQIKPIRSVRDDVSDAVSAACSLCASTPEKAADTSSIPAGLQTERMKNLKNILTQVSHSLRSALPRRVRRTFKELGS